jgi:hypothetical protein
MSGKSERDSIPLNILWTFFCTFVPGKTEGSEDGMLQISDDRI